MRIRIITPVNTRTSISCRRFDCVRIRTRRSAIEPRQNGAIRGEYVSRLLRRVVTYPDPDARDGHDAAGHPKARAAPTSSTRLQLRRPDEPHLALVRHLLLPRQPVVEPVPRARPPALGRGARGEDGVQRARLGHRKFIRASSCTGRARAGRTALARPASGADFVRQASPMARATPRRTPSAKPAWRARLHPPYRENSDCAQPGIGGAHAIGEARARPRVVLLRLRVRVLAVRRDLVRKLRRLRPKAKASAMACAPPRRRAPGGPRSSA